MEKPNKTEHALCSKETSTQIQDSERRFSLSFDNHKSDIFNLHGCILPSTLEQKVQQNIQIIT